MTISFYRNNRKYGRRRPKLRPRWLYPPSRPPDPSLKVKDPHENDIENTERYISECKCIRQRYLVSYMMITRSRGIIKAGRRTVVLSDHLYDYLQMDRYSYYNMKPIITKDTTPCDHHDHDHCKEDTNNSSVSPRSQSPQSPTIPQGQQYVDVHTISFPLFFILITCPTVTHAMHSISLFGLSSLIPTRVLNIPCLLQHTTIELHQMALYILK